MTSTSSRSADAGTLRAQAAALRRFTRFYTRRLGLLGDALLDSGYSMTQSRLLWEIAHRTSPSAGELARALALDPGYVSRALAALQRAGLLRKAADPGDRRQRVLTLTRAGHSVIASLERASQRQAEQALATLPVHARGALVDAMATVERSLEPLDATAPGTAPSAGPPAGRGAPYLLRPPRPGDYGHVISRQGALYAAEYGWDATFEALVAEIVAKFIRRYDARHERCWIAERDGAVVGSVFLVRQSARVGQLRLLYVEPAARGLGIGARLVAECIDEARRVGYRRLVLWTNDVLVSARRIYEAAGFRLASEERHHSFGKDLVGQYWALDLAAVTKRAGA